MSFFLSGLRWHLPGLSELPLKQRLLLLFAGECFPFFSLCFGRAIYMYILCFLGLAFAHVRACYRGASTVLQYRTHSRQHSTLSPRKAANQVRAHQSAITQASRHRASNVLQYIAVPHAQHSTAPSQPAQSRKASTYRSECDIRVRQRKQADINGMSQHVSSSICATR